MPRILVALDGQLKAEQPALQKAARLAAVIPDSHVDVFVNIRSRSLERSMALHLAELERIKESIHRAWDKRIDKLAEELDLDVAHKHIRWASDSFHGIMEEADARQTDLLVVHSHYEPRLKRLVFTPLEWKLIRESHCPLLFAGERAWPEKPPVVAAIDPPPLPEDEDPLTDDIVRTGLSFSDALRGEFSLVHSLEYPDETLVMVAGEAIPATVDLAESQRDLYRKLLDETAQRHHIDSSRALLLEGAAPRTLGEYMDDQGGGLLIMGSAQKTPLERFLLGSTAEQILYQCSADVLILKPGQQLLRG